MANTNYSKILENLRISGLEMTLKAISAKYFHLTDIDPEFREITSLVRNHRIKKWLESDLLIPGHTWNLK